MFLNGAFRSRKPVDVKPGDSYRRPHSQGLLETATVLELRNDHLGIPHVRFSVRFERAASEHIETAQRMLALGAFLTVYGAQAA